MSEEFDYIIVRAGSSGAVLANRLSADPRNNVCLIEAGSKGTNWLIDLPLGVIWLSKDKHHNWLHTSTPQTGLSGRIVSIPRGKVLGGSSAIKGMIYIQGHRADYDDWAKTGCTGWSYDEVFPYFQKSKTSNSAMSRFQCSRTRMCWYLQSYAARWQTSFKCKRISIWHQGPHQSQDHDKC